MTVQHFIKHLLYHHDCVIVPNLGGFLTQEHKTEVNSLLKSARPAYKSLAFNAKLNSHDGLLANHIANALQIDHQEASNKIQLFVDEVNISLNEKGNFNLDGLGTFYKGAEDKTIFVPLLSLNFKKSNFGLPTIKIAASAKTENEIEITTPIATPTVQPQVKKEELRRTKKLEQTKTPSTTTGIKGLKLINTLGSVFLLAMIFTLLNFEFNTKNTYEVQNVATMLDSHSGRTLSAEHKIKPNKDIRTLLSDYQNQIQTVYYKILLDGTFSLDEVEKIQTEFSQNYPQSKIIEVENNEYTISVISFMNEQLAKEYRDLIQKNLQYKLIITAK